MKKINSYLTLLVFSGLIVALDQVTKTLVRMHLAVGETWAPWPGLMPYARVFYLQNTGVAFSLFRGFGWIFSILAILAAIAILYYFPRVPRTDRLLRLSLILLMGGAVGNLIDRLTLGFVTDFISVGTFAVFNIADACLDAGVVGLMLDAFRKEGK